MIPVHLKLKNFLSYQQAQINFQGLHTVCICGSNGSGKSSLLESLTWALWGQSRAMNDDDVIHGGEREVQVDFLFRSQNQLYRVLRSHQRKQATVLEFQIAETDLDLETPLSNALADYRFRSLTEKGLRATQQRITDTLKLDYETFINSAYLRQGRADEFMLKRPSERKQVLADLLKLNQYDGLAEKAKERSREFKIQVQWLQESLQQLDQSLQQRSSLEQLWSSLEAELCVLQQDQENDRLCLESLQKQQQFRQQNIQSLNFLKQHQERVRQEQKRLLESLEVMQHRRNNLAITLNQGTAIQDRYTQWQDLQRREEEWAQKATLYQELQAQRLEKQTEIDRQWQQIAVNRQKYETQREQVNQQLQSLQPILAKKAEILEGLNYLYQARTQLDTFDRLQAQVTPLRQRQDALTLQLQRLVTQTKTRLDELRSLLGQLEAQQAQESEFTIALAGVNSQISYLEERQQYREQLREKGQERKSFLERLQAHQRDYETQLQELDQPEQPLEPGVPCPLCHRPLDELHWEQVQQQQLAQRQDILDMLLVVKDQLMVSNREIQVLRQEYRQVDQELAVYNTVLEQKGQLQQQLLACQNAKVRYQTLLQEVHHLDRMDREESWDRALQTELKQLTETIALQGYDDRSHALARGEVERWRWAEIRQAELQTTEHQMVKLQQKLPEIESELCQLEQQYFDLAHSPLQQQIQACIQQLEQVDYHPQEHDRVRQALRDAQQWPLQYQAWQQAQEEYPKIEAQIQILEEEREGYRQEWQHLEDQCQEMETQLQDQPDPALAIQEWTVKLHQRRQQLDQKLAELGRLEQQKQQILVLEDQQKQQEAKLKDCQYQCLLHTELSQAFGKNGLQALLIENLLPQLESETNVILSRLSAYQLHVQFITQRSRRQSSSQQEKLIDTLDIRIADARGTRPYETYSGGEAFRVNFAIRLALAKLLAQRSGSPLQLLIVDEGFGTQDAEGCDRLIAAINTIAPDFACILTITHMPQFKEAFQTRLEVEKGSNGSQIRLVC